MLQFLKMVSVHTAGDEHRNLFSLRVLLLVAVYFILSANGQQGINRYSVAMASRVHYTLGGMYMVG